MTQQLFEESSRTWYLYAHYDASTTDDFKFARALYERRIKELEWRIAKLEEEAANK